jgi:hypothetical protein
VSPRISRDVESDLSRALGALDALADMALDPRQAAVVASVRAALERSTTTLRSARIAVERAARLEVFP